jgi:hypothetical protein
MQEGAIWLMIVYYACSSIAKLFANGQFVLINNLDSRADQTSRDSTAAESVGAMINLASPLHAQPLCFLQRLRDPADLEPVFDGDGLKIGDRAPTFRPAVVDPEAQALSHGLQRG